jgi:hypothetical protein
MQVEVQFARVEAFRFTDVARIVGEASRVPEYCRHVERPEEPTWVLGSAERVVNLANAIMAVPCTYTQRDGKKAKRKRRHDFRCLVAGFCSWPMDIVTYRALKLQDPEAWNRERLRIVRWIESTNAWLRRVFGNRLAAVLLHLDESHPHIHFVCVGDARRLHPGLRAEYVDGVRIPGNVPPGTEPPWRSSWTTTTPKFARRWACCDGVASSRSSASRIGRPLYECWNWKNASRSGPTQLSPKSWRRSRPTRPSPTGRK